MRQFRALLLADGRSDEPLGEHVAALAHSHGAVFDVVAPDLDLLRPPPGRSVAERLERARSIDPDFDLVIVHRDGEAQTRDARLGEIEADLAELEVAWPCIPIVPIRMTEAWLLIDETAIRSVAGRPSGKGDLGLPAPAQVERIADPKALLRDALRLASGLNGRRLRTFDRDFPNHRRVLLQRLDRLGPVRGLPAWAALEADVERVVHRLLVG